MNPLLVSIIVPYASNDGEIRNELIPALKRQTYQHYELLLISDEVCGGGPAAKRDYAANKAKGAVLAFIDSDAYPADSVWLERAVALLHNPEIAAVAGPGLTPQSDSIPQRVSGLVWSSFLGAGAAGSYRNSAQKPRYVDDYPTSNLFVKKNDFVAAGGFDTQYWPGEDTKLCHELVHRLHKKILYSPNIQVYHHRRPVFLPHLIQVARFGVHRGFFVKTLPKTSLRWGYFLPLVFVVQLGLFPLWVTHPLLLYLYVWVNLSYLFVLIGTVITSTLKTRDPAASVSLFIAIPLTHIVYGTMFLKGLLLTRLER